MFNIKQLLEDEGHEVIPFSVKHNKNVATPYEEYFLSSIGSGDEVYFSDVAKKRKNIQEQWKATTSISTFACFGSSFTAKAARAG